MRKERKTRRPPLEVSAAIEVPQAIATWEVEILAPALETLGGRTAGGQQPGGDGRDAA